MIWFISDTHYHHRNIVRGISQWTDKSGCRNFDTQQEHDDFVVDLINQSVHRHDTLYHLGDWSFGGKDKIRELRDRINCERVHIIYGNHDHHIQAVFGNMDLLFQSRQHYRELAIAGQSVVLCHYPIESWNSMERGAIHQVATLPRATSQRHTSIEGGNKFGN